jgi:hypothetical protein
MTPELHLGLGGVYQDTGTVIHLNHRKAALGESFVRSSEWRIIQA